MPLGTGAQIYTIIEQKQDARQEFGSFILDKFVPRLVGRGLFVPR